MKKTTATQKRYRLRRAERHQRNSRRRKAYKYRPDSRHRLTAPAVFSFSEAFDETISMIREVKRHGCNPVDRHTVIEIDFSKTQSVSPAAALVLGAEIDRIMTLTPYSVRFVLVKFALWADKTRASLGYFGLLGLFGIDLNTRWMKEQVVPELTVSPMRACHKLAPRRVDEALQSLEKVAKFFSHRASLYEAMVEATGNTVNHAYPKDYDWEYEPTIGDTWWLLATYSMERGAVRVVVFDQGVGIPKTLDRWSLAEQVRGLLGNVTGGLQFFNDHARMIEAALEVSRSSKSSLGGRGQGLADVVYPVDENGAGHVRILSASGGVLYNHGGRIEHIHLSDDIGGTLVEWTIPVTNLNERDQNDASN